MSSNVFTFCVCFVLLGSAMNKDQWDPEFLKAIPIMKTRSGMQVKGDLWVVCAHRLINVDFVYYRSISDSCSVLAVFIYMGVRSMSCYCLFFLLPSFHAPLPATVAQTVAVRCGCVTVTAMWARSVHRYTHIYSHRSTHENNRPTV